MKAKVIVLVLTLVVTYSNASLYLVAINGNRYRRVSQLPNGRTIICPSTQTPNGFSIECAPRFVGANSRAVFFVNGSWRRTAISPPFFINGNRNFNRVPRKWTNYPKTATVTCRVRRNGRRQSFRAILVFECPPINNTMPASVSSTISAPISPTPTTSPSSTPSGTPSPSSTPSPSGTSSRSPSPSKISSAVVLPNTMYFRPARIPIKDLPLAPSIEVYDNVTFCPTTSFGEWPFTVQCGADSSIDFVRFFVRQLGDSYFEFVRFDGRPPFLMTSTNKKGNIRKLGGFQRSTFFYIRCRIDDFTLLTRRIRIGC